MAKQQSQEQAGSALSPGTVIDGRYKVVRFIGQGGNGLVHEVEHVRTGRRLALKSLVDESGYGRLEQEARATCLMRNDHAVRITDMGRTDSTGSFLVMELLEGQSLRALLEEAGQIPLELCVNIALQVCECLTEAHGHGIVHRDLKPENIYLSESEWPGQYNVRVLDFGVVKITNEGPIPSSSLTRTGSTVGTPYYMSLEQLRNPSTVDARADIYALGVVLYESLSGRKPFQAETIGDLVYALCSGPPTHLNRLRPDLPTDICDAIMRALSTKREDRQASMTDLAAVLLSHGNPVFGVWIRVNGKRPALALAPPSSAASSGPRANMRTTMAMQPGAPAPSPAPPSPASPTGIPRPAAGAPPSPLAPAVGIVANSGGSPSNVTPSGVKRSPQTSMTEAFVLPEGAPAATEHKMLPDVEVPTRIRPERPDISLGSGDRDTPTEMFVKGRHDAPSEPANRDTPTRGIPMDALQSPFANASSISGIHPPQDEDDFGTMRFNPDERPGQARLPPPMPEPSQGGSRSGNEMLGTMRLPADAEVAEVRAALNAQNILGTAPRGQQDIRSTARLPQDGPSFGPPPMAPPQGHPQINMMTLPPGLGTATMPPGMSPPKPGWQVSLDSALVGVGRFFERLFGPAIHRVRTAPPQTQLVLAAVAASFVAAILVIVIYVMLG